MKKYIGTKIIEAMPGTMAEAQALKDGVPVEVKEEIFRKSGTADKDGYIVKYPDGYISWSPKDVFEEAYRRCDNMPFGLALEAIKKGKRVTRKGWNGKGQYVRQVDPYNDKAFQVFEKEELDGTLYPYFALKNAQNGFLPWVPSIGDLLADDWEIVE